METKLVRGIKESCNFSWTLPTLQPTTALLASLWQNTICYNIESVHPTGHWKAFVLTPIVCPRREIGVQHLSPSGGWFRVPCLQKGWLIHVRRQAYYMRLGVKRKSDTIKVVQRLGLFYIEHFIWHVRDITPKECIQKKHINDAPQRGLWHVVVLLREREAISSVMVCQGLKSIKQDQPLFGLSWFTHCPLQGPPEGLLASQMTTSQWTKT